MSTRLYFGSADPTSYSLGQFPTRLDGTVAGYHLDGLGLGKGAGVVSRTVATVAGPTAGKEFHSTSSPNETEWHYVSQPFAEDVTISGTITFNLWGLEDVAGTNAGFQVVVERLRRSGNTESITTVVNSEHGTELDTSAAVRSWTASPTSTAFAKGDRLRIRVAVNDAGGTMAAGTATFRRGGTSDGADGDSYIEFTETFTLWDETSDPGGTVLYLRSSNPSGVNPGTNTEYEMLLGRGSSAADVNGVLNNTNGPGSPQDTEVEWYSDPLEADVDLEGQILANLRLRLSASSNTCWPRATIAHTAGDGTGATVIAAGAPGGNSLSTTETAKRIFMPCGPVTVAAGRRLRLNLYYDDGDNASFSTIATVITKVDGPTPGASGDSWVAFPVSLLPPNPPGPKLQPLVSSGLRYT